MARAGNLNVTITAKVAIAPGDVDEVRWHDPKSLRCRATFAIYRLSLAITRLADRIDAPDRHPR